MNLTEELKDLVGNGISKEQYDKILKNQEKAKKYSKLIELSMLSDHISLDDAIEKMLEDMK